MSVKNIHKMDEGKIVSRKDLCEKIEKMKESFESLKLKDGKIITTHPESWMGFLTPFDRFWNDGYTADEFNTIVDEILGDFSWVFSSGCAMYCNVDTNFHLNFYDLKNEYDLTLRKVSQTIMPEHDIFVIKFLLTYYDKLDDSCVKYALFSELFQMKIFNLGLFKN